MSCWLICFSRPSGMNERAVLRRVSISLRCTVTCFPSGCWIVTLLAFSERIMPEKARPLSVRRM